MRDIVNLEEMTRIAARMEPEPEHGPLLGALKRRYPDSEFNLVCTSSFHRDIGGLIGRNGETVSDDYKAWVTKEYRSAGGDAKAVYRKYNEAELAILEEQGEHVVITTPCGESPEAFLQMEFEATRRIAEVFLLDSLEPDCLEDLFHSSYCLKVPRILSPWRYGVRKLTNVQTFLGGLMELEHARRRTTFPERTLEPVRELIVEDRMAPVIRELPFLELYPGNDELPKEARFFQDWRESSAWLSGARLCAHWWLDLADAYGRLSYIPRWADSDCSFPSVSLGSRWSTPSPGSITSPPDFSLPRVENSAHRSVYTLMATLEEFDQRAGYPMAWFFYMLHGNRVEQAVGDAVAKAVKDGRIGLPEHDARVLARWREKSYGF